MKPEPKAILCGPVETLPRYCVVVGSKIVQCSECGCDCWMAPSTVLLIGPEDVIYCVPCGQAEMGKQADAGEEVEILNPSNPQIEEIKKHFAARARHSKED